jgi:hypothetical protein
MTSHDLPPARPRRPRFVPRLEALEGRLLLACKVFESAGNLTIVGDNSSNVVQIDDTGTMTPGNVRVFCDGVITQTQGIIEFINVKMGSGKDLVQYSINGLTGGNGTTQPATGYRNVTVDMGGGNDVFLGNVTGTITAGSFLDVEADGGPGNNRLSMNAAVTVPAGSIFNSTLTGGPGRTVMDTSFTGTLGGILNLLEEGGQGSNIMSLTGTTGSGSTTLGKARLYGGRGNNVFRLVIAKGSPSDVGAIDGLVVGGPGLNTAHRSRGTRAMGVQADFVSPPFG